MDLTAPHPGIPVVPSRDVPDGRYRPATTPHGPVTLLGIREHEATATCLVRDAMADVLAWLGSNAPDLRTGTEILADARALPTTATPPGILPGTAVPHLKLRDEGPCVWCGTWAVRYRDAGQPAAVPIACKPSHLAALKIPAQDARRREYEAERTARKEEERKALCRRPDKRHWRHKGDAIAALAQLRRDDPHLPSTVVVYECNGCGEWHVGNRAKTLQSRIQVVANSRKARRRIEGR